MTGPDLPNSPEAERALLGSLLIAGSVPPEVERILAPEDLYLELHRWIYQAQLRLQHDGRPVDHVTLCDALERAGRLGESEKQVSEAYLAQLIGEVPTHMHAEHYARIAAGHAADRRILLAAGRAAGLAHSGKTREALAELEHILQAERPQAAPAGWEWRSLAQALEPKPERSYVVPGVLPVPYLAMAFGSPGTLKTMLAMDLATCVAGGDLWLEGLPGARGVRPFAVLPQPVLWVDVDNGRDRTERRLAALARGHSVEPSAPLSFVSFPSPPFVAGDEVAVRALIAAVTSTQAGLVVVDNLAAVSGGADENSGEMLGVMAGLRRIAEEGHCCVLVIHHKSKGERTRAGDGVRGYSGIEGALDLALLVSRQEDGDVLTLRSTKTRDMPVSPFLAAWSYEQDLDGELSRGRFYGLGRPEAAALSKQGQAELCIARELPSGGMSQREVVDMVKTLAGVGRHTTLAALRAMAARKELVTRPGDGGAVLYEAPAAGGAA